MALPLGFSCRQAGPDDFAKAEGVQAWGRPDAEFLQVDILGAGKYRHTDFGGNRAYAPGRFSFILHAHFRKAGA